MRFLLYRTLFVAFLMAELLLVTSQRVRYMGHRENAITLTLLAVLMGVFALLAAFEKRKTPDFTSMPQWEPTLLRILSVLGIAATTFHFFREISVIPIDIRLSDILPTIQVMNHRLMAGQYPYSLIQDFGYDLNPTYLPLMWMPFLPAEWFDFDERWMAYFYWILATLALHWQLRKGAFSSMAKWFITALPLFFFIFIEEGTDATFGNTIEIMIAGFYMLFAYQLAHIRSYLTGSPVKMGILLSFFLVLCLLSRYSFLLWLPFLAAVVWVENRRLALSTTIGVLTGVLLLFVLPFLLQDPMVYFKGLQYYSKAALGGWGESGNPSPLYDGMGLAGIFRDEVGGDMAHRLSVLQRWQLILSLTTVAICAAIWWKKRSKIQDLPLFLLGSLKCYFAIFYGFVQMPYVYLMLTPCFFSIAMLLVWYRAPLKAALVGNQA